MEKVKIEILGLSSSQSQSTGSFALVLGEVDGERRLPIIIGMFEAQAIALEIEKITPNRPMTHDLFKSFAHAFNYEITEVIISDLKEGIFFAKIVCTDGARTMEVDSRPSDAIAIGIRFGVPFYTYESVLAEAGIILTDDEEIVEEQDEPVVVEKKGDRLQDFTIDKLNEMLDEALKAEDYERAAKIRDEINRRS
ncbi:bifunctional nuclease domain-containing protein [Roseivirga sp. UBA1976]|uniref:bifunctional nuclease family protein n=1 Tax=Roseivirga sp. UBA1976 TaxID=1947386 RepID=UPI00257D03F0|nr:bifunctional nuclease domain-containing protein [Roseivirga sp. UBA1976]MEC7753476.1 bifunctional nuclease domain-containing protein [Bacteroidota bacterium]